MTNTNIKLIIVDLYGVISVGSYRDICGWIAKKYHMSFEKVYEVVYHKYFSAAAVGKMSEADSFRLAMQELGLKESWQEIRARHYVNIVKLNKPALEWAKKVQKDGYKVLMLSKNTKPQFLYTVKTLNLRKYFKNIVNTLNLGLPKASKETMLWVFKKFKVKPQEVLFIDDQDFNLPEAKKLGVHTVHYKTFGQMKKEIEKLL